MKKSNNSNPLKYFNDAAVARAKSVNAGNDKLVKAQVGYTNVQGPITEKTSVQTDMLNAPTKISKQLEENQKLIKNMVDFERANTNFKPESLNLREKNFKNGIKKTGGTVNSKKK